MSGILRKGLCVLLVGLAVCCTAFRLEGIFRWNDLSILAAQSTLPAMQGNYEKTDEAVSAAAPVSPEKAKKENSSPVTDKKKEAAEKENSTAPEESTAKEFVSHEPDKKALEKYEKEHEGEEKYPVLEFTSTQGNTSYDGVQVKNTSSATLDIKKELEGRLGFTIEKTDKPQVLIYHTHTSESFLEYDTGYYFESFYPRSSDKAKNVCAVGDEIASALNCAGICTIHDTTVHDDPSYSGAYYRSYDTVQKYLNKYPTIKIVLDIHRDGIGTDSSRSKPVFTANGRKAAQMMILAGYNYDDSEEFRDWEYNLRFALQLQKAIADEYPDMVRPVNFSDFMYNMNINTGSLLIEIGADSNTLEEVRYTGWLLGQILSKMLKNSRKSG